MIFPGLPNLWDPLDVSNLSEDWPRWSMSFEILIVAACNNDLADRQKLAIFLHCLGRNGRDITREWFPQLMNFNSQPAKEVTFGLVWNRMNAHCQTVPVDTEEAMEENVPKEEDQIQPPEITEQKLVVVVDEVHDENVNVEEVLDHFNKEINGKSEIYPLPLRELELFVKRYPGKRWIVNEYLKRDKQLIIDSWTLADHPFENNQDLYLEYGRVTTNLHLYAGSLDCFVEPLSCFKNLAELTLSCVKLTKLDDWSMFPQTLRKLHVEDSAIPFLYPWLEVLKPSLQSLHIEQVSLDKCETKGYNSETAFDRMKSLTVIERHSTYLFCPSLEYLYYDAPNCSSIGSYNIKCKHLTTLKIRRFDEYEYDFTCTIKLSYFKRLQALEILYPVSKIYATAIESLNLKSVKVQYIELPPTET